MTNIGVVVQKLRQECGFSQRRLAVLSGVSNTEIKRIEDGLRKRPSQEVLAALAKGLQTNPAELYHAAGYVTEVRELPSTPEVKSPIYISKQITKIPVFTLKNFETMTWTTSNIIDWEELPGELLGTGDFIYYQVNDDSMSNSHIPQNGRVLVRLQDHAGDRAIALVAIDQHHVMIRQLHCIEDRIILVPTNPNYSSEIHRAADVQVLGVVVRSIIKFE